MLDCWKIFEGSFCNLGGGTWFVALDDFVGLVTRIEVREVGLTRMSIKTKFRVNSKMKARPTIAIFIDR